MLGYHFFDYKFNIENFSSDLFSVSHIIFIVLSFVLVILLSIIFRKTSHKKMDVFIKVLSIVVAVLALVKIIWEICCNVFAGSDLNIAEILPLDINSLFVYCLLIAAWCKNKMARECSLTFIATISMLGGAIGIVQCNWLNWYPFWTFGALCPLIFYLVMFATGMLLLFTCYKKLEWRDALLGLMPVLILAIVAIPVNYLCGTDYMKIYAGSGIPVLSTFAQVLAVYGLRFIFTFIMLIAYIAFAAVVICLAKLICLIDNKIKAKKSVSEPEE